MPVFYRGAGVGTWWHRNDARHEGFFAWRPAKEGKVNDVVNHIVRGTVSSPYISLTRSYGVAFSYAVRSGHEKPAKENPSFVYEVHLPESVTDVQLLDPIVEIVSSLPKPLENSLITTMVNQTVSSVSYRRKNMRGNCPNHTVRLLQVAERRGRRY